ncbi:DUF6702 family protein [Mariniflexile sp.]|uniref:DUF6702 family protein n=1 Tax=Mariniflexile sp. TaxID=1979402 RepID=UPI0035634628
MKRFIILLVLPLFAFTSFHKYYISVTQIDYIERKQSVQIISRIFIDDLERLIRERYDETITLGGKKESLKADEYIQRYLGEKMIIKINGKRANLTFVGKEYDVDLVKCYLEIEDVKKIESFEISNKVLFDLFDDQQNIIKTKINSKQKSVILIPQNESFLFTYQ